MYTIHTQWSSDNLTLQRLIEQHIRQQIKEQRQDTRYRCLAFYFFEKEITSDIYESVITQSLSVEQLLSNPEYQALMARHASSEQGGQIWDEIIVLSNDYIFQQGDFVSGDDQLLSQLVALLSTHPYAKDSKGLWMSDVIFQLQRARTDVLLVRDILADQYDSQSLYKACAQYIGTYAEYPRCVALINEGFTLETMEYLLSEDGRLRISALLEPSYEIICHGLDGYIVMPYGHIDVFAIGYTTWFGQLGRRRSSTLPWYGKIGIVLAIMGLSGWIGGISLWLLPIVWGLLTLSRSVYQYLLLFQQLIYKRYTDYTSQHRAYISLYDTMIDPDTTSKESMKSEHLMTRRYDIIPLAGHDLIWDATLYARQLYDMVVKLGELSEEVYKQYETISATLQWGKDKNFHLPVVQENTYPEQVIYRLYGLWNMMKKRHEITDIQSHEQYAIIDEMIENKRYDFLFWTHKNALWDGVTLAISSGLIGWMGSYLRNRTIVGQTALAAGGGIVAHTLAQSDNILLDSNGLIDSLTNVMSQSDIQLLSDHLATQAPEDTLWDTMVEVFGERQGNIYTNRLMDSWRRVSTDGQTSILFDQSFANGLPIAESDVLWDRMIGVLDRIYRYDNLTTYQELIHQDRLAEILEGLRDGSLSLETFAQMDSMKREIVVQAAFLTFPQDEIVNLLNIQPIDIIKGVEDVERIDVVIEDTILTGSQDNVITGDISSGIVSTGSVNMSLRDKMIQGFTRSSVIGDVDIVIDNGSGEITDDIFVDGQYDLSGDIQITGSESDAITGDTIALSRWDRLKQSFARPSLQTTGTIVGTGEDVIVTGWVDDTTITIGSGLGTDISINGTGSGQSRRQRLWARPEMSMSSGDVQINTVSITGDTSSDDSMTASIDGDIILTTSGNTSLLQKITQWLTRPSVTGDIVLTGDQVDLLSDVLTGDVSVSEVDGITGQIESSSRWDNLTQWFGATSTGKYDVTISDPVGSGDVQVPQLIVPTSGEDVDVILSGLSSDELTQQANDHIDRVVQVARLQTSPFTVPVIRSSKKIQ